MLLRIEHFLEIEYIVFWGKDKKGDPKIKHRQNIRRKMGRMTQKVPEKVVNSGGGVMSGFDIVIDG